jgi:hypothetical protein
MVYPMLLKLLPWFIIEAQLSDMEQDSTSPPQANLSPEKSPRNRVATLQKIENLRIKQS